MRYRWFLGRTFITIVFLLLALFVSEISYGASAPTMNNYCVVPPFASQAVPPLVMLILSKDQQQFFAAYTDTVDLDGDGVPDVTYKDSIAYYGYFDSNKCYDYSSGVFVPSGWVSGYNSSTGTTTNHYCSGNWSGNFMNWATMSRLDVLLKVVYGGRRDTPENNNNTVLSTVLVPDDAHARAKVYTGSDLAQLTPGTNTAITMCVANCTGNQSNASCNETSGRVDVYWGDKTTGPASPSNTGGQYYPDAASHDGGSVSGNPGQCRYKYQGDTVGLSGGTTYYTKVQVCTFSGTDSSMIEPNCMEYGTSSNPAWRPAGLMQKYGTNRHGTLDTTQWTNQMYFGLMTGSYDKNKSGGVIRSNISSINSEIGSTDGKKKNSSSLIQTLQMFSPADYDWKAKDWGSGCGLSATFTEGNCRDWGNPIGEEYYEALRYFIGKQAPRKEYAGGDTSSIFANMPNQSVPNAWCNPYDPSNTGDGTSATCAYFPPCSKPFILILSDIYPSFDSDQLPGSNFGGIADDSGYSLNVDSLLDTSHSSFNKLELANNSLTSIFIGDEGASVPIQYECTAKPTTDVGFVRGLCPEEPAKEGSYYLPGLAWWARTQGFNNNGQHKVTTFAVATPTKMPDLEINVNTSTGTKTVQILPIFKDLSMAPSRGQLANFRILTTATPTGGTCSAGSTNCVPCPSLDSDCTTQQGKRYQYGYEMMWDDSGQGNDYDLDIQYRIFVRDNNNGTVTVKTKGVYAAAGHTDVGGYSINGVSSPGEYFEIGCGNNTDNCRRYCSNNTTCGTAYKDDEVTIANYNMPPANGAGMLDSTIVRTFTVADTSADFLENPLYYAAKYGGFDDRNGNNIPDQTAEWYDSDRNLPNTYFYASNPNALEGQLETAFQDILKRASSGTAVSVLASSGGSGALIQQAVFFPLKDFTEAGGKLKQIMWTGQLQNLWYYIDPILKSSSIREETDDSSSPYKLDLANDYIINFFFDNTENKTRVNRSRDNRDGTYTYIDTVEIDQLKNLWEAGNMLWNRDLSTSPRKLYTYPIKDTTGAKLTFTPPYDLSTGAAAQFTTTNEPNLRLDLQVASSDTTTGASIINYITGYDVDVAGSHRNRTVSNKVWKLADIVDSTPSTESSMQLNDYNLTPPGGYSDTTYGAYIGSNDYKNRGIVYVGTNDGMFHAIRLGTFSSLYDPSNKNLIAQLSGSGLGTEEWAYIPYNTLPYLRYFADPNYCHLYYVDATPFLFDAMIARPSSCTATNDWDCTKNTATDGSGNLDLSNTSWRTVVIGGMGLGGACKAYDTKCSTDTPNGVCAPNTLADGTSIGYSSYFALDVTEPLTPHLLWEFSDPELGYTTSGPAIVKISATQSDGVTPDKTKNGKWFAVFASGPTGPIDTTSRQFMGTSDQKLRLFILDLKTGTVLRKIIMDGSVQADGTSLPTLANAFGGSLMYSTVDVDRAYVSHPGNYQDDVVYIGYSQASGTGWAGGVLRLQTNENLDPAKWTVSTLISGIGPVSTSVDHILDTRGKTITKSGVVQIIKGEFWTYFGSGRYFYKYGSTVDDTSDLSQRAIYGVKDPCYNKNGDNAYAKNCSDSATVGNLVDATSTAPTTEDSSKNGWVIYLNQCANSSGAVVSSCTDSSMFYGNERVITNPVSSPLGAVFFTTFVPSADACGFGGNSYLWAVGYNTGGQVSSAALRGTALIQVSTGSIEQIDLKSAFTASSGRKTGAIVGKPPGPGVALVLPPRPAKRILHIRER